MELEFGNIGFSMEGGKPENPEKNPRSKDENQQQTAPVELCIILYKVFLTLILWMKSESVTIQMKAF